MQFPVFINKSVYRKKQSLKYSRYKHVHGLATFNVAIYHFTLCVINHNEKQTNHRLQRDCMSQEVAKFSPPCELLGDQLDACLPGQDLHVSIHLVNQSTSDKANRALLG